MLNLCDLWISVGNTPRWIEQRRDGDEATDDPDSENGQQGIALGSENKEGEARLWEG